MPRLPAPRRRPDPWFRTAGLGWAVWLLVAAASHAADPWLDVDAPQAAERVEHALLEVRGQGGSRRGAGHDIVLVIDVSESTLEHSGLDLDGDGRGGRTSHQLMMRLHDEGVSPRVIRKLERHDFDDTVLAAELEAARALVDRLDLARFRMALVAFADEARVLAPLGSSRPELRSALEDVLRDFHRNLQGTHFAAAVETAHDLVRPEPGHIDDRLRSIVLLTDGAPTRPVHGDRAERYALRAAMAAGFDGIQLFAFAIGPEAEKGLEVMERMTSWTSGQVESVSNPSRIVSALRALDLVGLADLAITNRTTGDPARAMRTFPDGSFDAFVELTPGPNRLSFEAQASDGRSHAVERLVHYEPRAARDADTAAQTEASAAAAQDPTLAELQRRTAELETWAAAERARERRRKEVEIRVEADDRPRSRAPATAGAPGGAGIPADVGAAAGAGVPAEVGAPGGAAEVGAPGGAAEVGAPGGAATTP